jgi:hypothetical protein
MTGMLDTPDTPDMLPDTPDTLPDFFLSGL